MPSGFAIIWKVPQNGNSCVILMVKLLFSPLEMFSFYNY